MLPPTNLIVLRRERFESAMITVPTNFTSFLSFFYLEEDTYMIQLIEAFLNPKLRKIPGALPENMQVVALHTSMQEAGKY